MSDESEFRRLSQAIEQETRRRKRVVAVYLLLLLVPVIALVAVISLGWSDDGHYRSIVRSEVEPLTEIVEGVEPAVIRIEEFGATMAGVQSTLQEVEYHANAIESLQKKEREMSDSIEPLIQDIKGVREDLIEIEASMGQQNESIARLSDRPVVDPVDLRRTIDRLTRLEQQLPQTTEQLKVQIGNLERTHKNLEARVSSNESKLARVEINTTQFNPETFRVLEMRVQNLERIDRTPGGQSRN